MQRISAYERFRARLLSGELKPGQFVTQRELAHLAGVPLGAAREAIQQLEHDRLLKVYPQRGIQVADVTVGALRDAFEYREILETYAIRQFAGRVSDAALDALERGTRGVLARAANGITRAVQNEAVEIDWRMHDQIVDSLGNEIVSRNYRVNAARIRLMRVDNRLSPDRLSAALSEHLEVLEALRARDADRAVDRLRAHLAVARQRALDGR